MINDFLEIDSIQKYINDKILLSDIYIKCKVGDVIGLFGRNGSGKSTLFNIIFGVEKCNHKNIRINNVVIKSSSEIFKNISYLPQNYVIPSYLSVKKSILLSIDEDNYIDFIDDLFISNILNQQIKNLSVGELRYLQIKLLLFGEKKFIILDEPYSGLSPIAVESINKLICIFSPIKGIIICDHNYKMLLDISNRLLLLKEGKVYFISNESELVEKGYLNFI